MKTASSLILSSVLIGLATAATVSSQSLPQVWNRSADWVPMQNPSPDSSGNLVWHCYQRRNCCTVGLSATWDPNWIGWVYGYSRWLGSAPITRHTLIHRTISNGPFVVKPEVWFRNTTNESFLLSIEGSLSAFWSLGTQPAFPPAIVEIDFLDWSQGNNVTRLLTSNVTKPSTTMSTRFTINLPTIRVDPGDVIRYTIYATTGTSTDSYVGLNDADLRLVRKSQALATETIRNATPNNPMTLNPGRTTRPIIGQTWDPYLTNSPTGATASLLAVGVTMVHVPTPFGTLLTDPLVTVPGMPGADFAIPIPKDIALAGATMSVQGASVAASAGLQLSNALDIRVGDF